MTRHTRACTAIAAALAIGTACSRGKSGIIEQQPVSPYEGPGYALFVPTDSKVTRRGDDLTVDAADGFRWFDLRFLPRDANALATFEAWATETCPSHALDPLENPFPSVYTVGGVCTIEHRRHWLVASLEPWGDGQIAMLYAADASLVTIEDAWVDLARTALTVVPGDHPLVSMSPVEVRAAARAAQAEGDGFAQTPGGGVLWGRTSKRLTPLWQARQSAAPKPTTGE